MTDQTPADISAVFPIRDQLTFLNHAAVAPLSGPAAAAVRRYADQAATRAYCGASWYSDIRRIKGLAARLIGARGDHEIAFVPNTSAGLATVARGLDFKAGDDVVITEVEYPANRYPWEDLKRLGVRLIEVPQTADGRIVAEDVCEAITDRTRVVAISHVQYASGCRTELRSISDMVHRAGGYLCVDAIQSVGVLPVDVQAMGIDFLSADGHKWMLAPEGCGIFYCHEDLIEMLHPPVVGWMNMVNATDYSRYQFEFQSDARRFEPGSYNIAGIQGLGASIELLLEVGIERIWEQVDGLCQALCKGLAARDYRVFSPRHDAGERSGIVAFQPPYPDTRITPSLQEIVTQLEAQGIIITVRDGRLRASPHFYNTREQIDRLVAALP